MFKKNVRDANSRQLGGKDVKKLRADVLKHFPALADEETLALLFPPKAILTQTKLTNKSIMYGTEDGTPLFFDPTGHGDKLLPTVRLNLEKKSKERKYRRQNNVTSLLVNIDIYSYLFIQ